MNTRASSKRCLEAQAAKGDLKDCSSAQAREDDSCLRKASPSTPEILQHFDKMLKSNEYEQESFLPELIEDIDFVLSKAKENPESDQESSKFTGKETASEGFKKFIHKIKSVGEKIFSEENTLKTVNVLNTLGQCHWTAVGLLLVASVLEKFNTVRNNRRECVMLLKSMNDLAKMMLELRPLPDKTAYTQSTITESMHMIFKGAMACSEMMKTDSMLKSVEDCDPHRQYLLDLRREIEELRTTLHVHISVCIFRFICKKEMEKEGRKRSGGFAEVENEGSNKRSRIDDGRCLNESTKPTQIPRTAEGDGEMKSPSMFSSIMEHLHKK